MDSDQSSGMSRPTGRTRGCTPADVRARLKDAADFLEAAEMLSKPGKGDVVATNAIHSAIAAADVICCVHLGQRSNDGNHRAAVDLLGKVEPGFANLLRRALDRKQQAGYESRDLADSDAASCVEQARKLYAHAQNAAQLSAPTRPNNV